MLAAGDRAAADRAVTWLFTASSRPTGRSRRTRTVDGSPGPAQHPARRDGVPDRARVAARRAPTTRPGPACARPPNALVRARARRRRRSAGRRPAATRNSTTAGEIAGLVAAADLARRRGDTDARARCGWASPTRGSAAPRTWMFTTNGPLGDGRYYVRIDDDGDPNDGSERDFGNAAGVHKENEVVDAGFLELVRLGVKAPERPVRRRLAPRDRRVAGHRHAERARVAPLHVRRLRREGRRLAVDVQHAGHRGPRVAAARAASAASTRSPTAATGCRTCSTMANTANDGFMIPEQVWDEAQPAPAALRLPARQGDRLGLAAGVGDGPVRAPRARDRGRPAGRDARGRARPLRDRRAPRGAGARDHRRPQDGSLADSRAR